MAAALTPRDVALAVAPGALALLDPTTLPPRALAAYRLGLVATTAASALDGLRGPETHAPPVVRWLGAAAVTGLMWRTMPFWERADAASHRWLRARGVRRSRLVVAVASTAATLALTAAERRRAAVEAADGAEAEVAIGSEQPAR